MLEDFKKFAIRGNVVDLAMGVIFGASLSAIVNSLVGDLLMPVVSAVSGGLDFSNYFVPLSPKVTADSLVEAKKQGAVLAWGNFVSIIINFLIIAWVLYILMRIMNRLLHAAEAKTALQNRQEVLLTEIRDALRARPTN
jgi:large conductance mechanosensitive channel